MGEWVLGSGRETLPQLDFLAPFALAKVLMTENVV